jgi:hypothetical protein
MFVVFKFLLLHCGNIPTNNVSAPNEGTFQYLFVFPDSFIVALNKTYTSVHQVSPGQSPNSILVTVIIYVDIQIQHLKFNLGAKYSNNEIPNHPNNPLCDPAQSPNNILETFTTLWQLSNECSCVTDLFIA